MADKENYMILGAAQFHPSDDNIDRNINIHMELIKKACEERVDFIQFPEMSLCGYQREKAELLAFIPNDNRLVPFRNISSKSGITLSMGAPILIDGKLHIGTFIITPDREEIYLKHHLHTGEEIYFYENTSHNPQIELDKHNLGFAICYDVENKIHWEKAFSRHTDIYSAGIFYLPGSMKKLHTMVTKQSLEYNMNVIISNYCISTYGMEAGGGSGIWSRNGENIVLLDSSSTGLAIAKRNEENWSGKTVYI